MDNFLGPAEVPAKPNKTCQVCGKPEEYEPNPEIAGQPDKAGLARMSMFYWRVAGHDQCQAKIRAQQEAERAEEEAKAKKEQWDRMKARANLADPRLESFTYDSLRIYGPHTNGDKYKGKNGNELAHAMLRTWRADAPDPYGIFITGPTGTGKTHMLLGFCWEHLRKGTDLLFYNVPQMLAKLRKDMQDEKYDKTLERLQNVPILALDDLGAEKQTEWALEQIFLIVDYRTMRRLPIFATSNFGSDGLAMNLNERIASRLRELCVWATIEGADFRATKTKSLSNVAGKKAVDYLLQMKLPGT